jgi:hypothetical protein
MRRHPEYRPHLEVDSNDETNTNEVAEKATEENPTGLNVYASEITAQQEMALASQLEEWLKLYPEAFSANVETQQAQADRLRRREQLLDDQELTGILEEYGVNIDDIELDGAGNYRLRVTNHFTDQRLPNGYAYKGGAARALALRNLGLSLTEQPRDLDVVRTVAEEPGEGLDDEVSRQFMPEDVSHGHGVEVVPIIDEYFATRDFTFNEVLSTDTEVVMTRQCLLDLTRRIIRLTDFESRDGEPSQKLLAKQLRLYAEAIAKYGSASIEDNGEWEYEEGFIAPFWLALQMERAFERGPDVAQRYTEELKQRNQIPQNIVLAEEAAAYLSTFIDNFYYRHAPVSQFQKENEWLDKYDYEGFQGGIKGFGRN